MYSFAPRTLAIGLLSLAVISGHAQLNISSATRDRSITVSDTPAEGVITIESALEVTGPWFPEKNALTLGSPVTVEMEPRSTDRFYRALSVDLSPAAGGFTNLIQSFSILSTVAGAGLNTANNLNLWNPAYEGARATSVELSRPHIAMADRAGNIYIADKWSHSILKVRPDGILVTAAGTHVPGNAADTATVATNANLSIPNGLWVREDGTLYIYDTGNFKVRKVTPQGIMTTLFSIPSATGVGRGLWVSDDESLAYICDGNNVRKWTPDGGVVVHASGFSQLGNLAIDHNGELVVTDRDAHRVYRISDTGAISIIAGNGQTFGGGTGQPALLTAFEEVRAVCFLPTGGYFLGTHDGSDVWYVDTAGIAHLFIDGQKNSASQNGDGTYFYAPGDPRMSEVRQITLDYDGNLIICEHDAGNIRKVQFLRHFDD